MTRILLIRHGETAWNAVRRLQGHTDIPLNEEGARQAKALAHALSSESLDAIVSSDLVRALQTAQAVAAHHPHIPLHTDAGLRERCYGAFEGLLYTEIAERYPVEFAEWQARDVDSVMPAGEREAESFRQFYQRCVDGIGRWAAQFPGKTIAIVAHGGVLECAYRAARGLTLDGPRDFTIRNATVNRFHLDGGALRLDSWGEAVHLDSSLDEML
jgi:2,3-bisphosphoglycerate-dependent phosphoglycerate mutase